MKGSGVGPGGILLFRCICLHVETTIRQERQMTRKRVPAPRRSMVPSDSLYSDREENAQGAAHPDALYIAFH